MKCFKSSTRIINNLYKYLMRENYLKKIKTRLVENINLIKKEGIIIASPSNDPPYIYHWIRDSALVMKAIIDIFKNTKKSKYFTIIINYLENEYQLQKVETIGGLGEPKYNVDRSAYNDPWGRPQNDGPALRGLNAINLYNYFIVKYPVICENLIKPILLNDLNYLINNYDKPCFDLWEEIWGWHFYTRVVQIKFFKEFIKMNKTYNIYSDVELLNKIYDKLLTNLKDHIAENNVISSFNDKGEIIRCEDASIFLAISHINYDKEILDLFEVNSLKNVAKSLIDYFSKKYVNSYNLIGRYKDDKYYNGQIWFICSLAVTQFYCYLYFKYPKNNIYEFLVANQIFEYIINIDENLFLAEQYNPDTKKQLSAKELTWNYTELYFSFISLNKLFT